MRKPPGSFAYKNSLRLTYKVYQLIQSETFRGVCSRLLNDHGIHTSCIFSIYTAHTIKQSAHPDNDTTISCTSLSHTRYTISKHFQNFVLN